jgi:hypothetical protein
VMTVILLTILDQNYKPILSDSLSIKTLLGILKSHMTCNVVTASFRDN